MGNKYIWKFCEKCKEETCHRVTKKYSAKKRKRRRETTKCQQCGEKFIDNLEYKKKAEMRKQMKKTYRKREKEK